MKIVNWAKMGTLLLGMIVLAGCGEETETITYGNMEIQYSDDSVTVEYKTSDEDEVENTEAEPGMDYDPEQVIDLFDDVEEWLQYSGTDGKGDADIVIPDDYTREYKGYYFKKCTAYGVDNQITIIYDNKLIGYVQYWVPDYDGNTGYSAGDVFEIELTFIPSDIMKIGEQSLSDVFTETGHILLYEKMNCVFPEQGGYIREKSQLETKHIDTIYDYLEDITDSYFGDSPNRALEKDSVFFGTVKPGEIAHKGSKSLISAFAYREKGVTDGDILFIYLYDLRETPEGELDIENYEAKVIDMKWAELGIDDYLSWYDSYEYELIG